MKKYGFLSILLLMGLPSSLALAETQRSQSQNPNQTAEAAARPDNNNVRQAESDPTGRDPAISTPNRNETSRKSAETPGSGAPGPTVIRISSVDSFMNNKEKYDRVKVSLTGHAERKIGADTFIMVGDGVIKDHVVVLASKELLDQNFKAKADLNIVGTARTAKFESLKNELPANLDPKVQKAIKDAGAYIMAESITVQK